MMEEVTAGGRLPLVVTDQWVGTGLLTAYSPVSSFLKMRLGPPKPISPTLCLQTKCSLATPKRQPMGRMLPVISGFTTLLYPEMPAKSEQSQQLRSCWHSHCCRMRTWQKHRRLVEEYKSPEDFIQKSTGPHLASSWSSEWIL